MTDLDARLNDLLERDAVEQTLLRYASTIDVKDFATLRTLFCDDVHAEFPGVEVDGGDEFVQWIDSMTADCTWQHHLLSVYHVDLVSDTEAHALTYHTSHQTKADAPNRCVRIVARYTDELRKEDGRWKIAAKTMHVGWTDEIEVPEPATAD